MQRCANDFVQTVGASDTSTMVSKEQIDKVCGQVPDRKYQYSTTIINHGCKISAESGGGGDGGEMESHTLFSWHMQVHRNVKCAEWTMCIELFQCLQKCSKVICKKAKFHAEFLYSWWSAYDFRTFLQTSEHSMTILQLESLRHLNA